MYANAKKVDQLIYLMYIFYNYAYIILRLKPSNQRDCIKCLKKKKQQSLFFIICSQYTTRNTANFRRMTSAGTDVKNHLTFTLNDHYNCKNIFGEQLPYITCSQQFFLHNMKCLLYPFLFHSIIHSWFCVFKVHFFAHKLVCACSIHT